MPVTTVSAAVHITPVVIRTFFEHGKIKAKKFKAGSQEEDATDDILFHQAFEIVKAFIELGTKNTIESLQGFTNTHVPSPYWAATSPVSIPFSTCNRAADTLIEWFSPHELKHVVGGERWWQVRGLDGIDAEWITQKEYLSTEPVPDHLSRKLSATDADILRMDKLERVMFYVHGGGYFWGSINTHRYQIIRYARKIHGRAFAVNYRKAPQYPWPCPLQDVIAAYLYLVDPPPNALHTPVHPSKIVFAGDSAGGGLCLAALAVLRDIGLPLPAGAVLISPWVDLTHSFPSVMHNTSTDIIPPYGFMAKPSTLWPVDLVPPEGGRVAPTRTNPPPCPGHSDTLKPKPEDLKREQGFETPPGKVKSQGEMLAHRSSNTTPDEASLLLREEPSHVSESPRGDCDVDQWEPKPPKVLMKDSDAVPLELRSQIQIYATTEQLSHPLVSPIMQSSLCNLPPLYIIAGDGEVLRDEIVYLAHRTAYPDQYPVRLGALRDARRQKENLEKFKVPTKVHLQVFDGMCHVPTVFTFTESAKYAYRSIAEFIKHVTDNTKEHTARNPFPELCRPPSAFSILDGSDEEAKQSSGCSTFKQVMDGVAQPVLSPHTPEGAFIYKANEVIVAKELGNRLNETVVSTMFVQGPPLEGSEVLEIPNIRMIRERVDIHGRVRSMEPREEVPALKVKPIEVGLIKEPPTLRWLTGQEEWDRMFKREAKRALTKRRKLEAKARAMIENARAQGLLFAHERPPRSSTSSHRRIEGDIQRERRWGPLDLEGERPPASAIAGRRDTPEALALLKKTIYHTAPVTHQTIPRLKPMDVVRAVFDPNDNPVKAPKQSVSEQQVRAHIIPIHGLRIWDALVGYFAKKSSTKAVDGTKHAAAAMKRSGGSLGVGRA